MTSWEGLRSVSIVSACMNADGTSDFALNEVEVTHEQFENGIHYYLAEAELLECGYEEPFVHFGSEEGPRFLLPAVREYLGMSPEDSTINLVTQSEER